MNYKSDGVKRLEAMRPESLAQAKQLHALHNAVIFGHMSVSKYRSELISLLIEVNDDVLMYVAHGLH